MRLGFVTEAAVEQLVETLETRFPGLPPEEIRAAALAQAEDLRAAGWRITGPVSRVTARSRARGRTEGQA